MQVLKIAIIITGNPELFIITNRMIDQILSNSDRKFVIDKYVSLSSFKEDREYTHVFHDGCYVGPAKEYYIHARSLKFKEIEEWLI